jgi:hypothetical protein
MYLLPLITRFLKGDLAMTMISNGRSERKSLASQIDRLDAVIDALSDGLNQAVERAVEMAAERAVANALARTLQNAHVLNQATKPNLLVRLAKWTWKAIAGAAANLWTTISGTGQTVAQKLKTIGLRVKDGVVKTTLGTSRRFGLAVLIGWLGLVAGMRLFSRHPKQTLFASQAGLLVGAGAYFAGPVFAATISGLSGATLVLLTMVMTPIVCRGFKDKLVGAEA